MTDPALLLESRDLTVRYGARPGILGVSLGVGPSEVVALVGPNGAGKTTFVRAILGLVPATSGQVLVEGLPLASLSYRQRAMRMAWLPQEEQPQENVAVLDYVMFGRYAHVPPFYPEGGADHARAEAALRSVGLWDRRESGIWEVSGGERQRVLLARAFAQEAPILLLDEPTSHLDISHQLELLDRLRGWVKGAARCVVAAMHDLNLASRYADRVVVLSRGRLVEDGRPERVLSPGLLRSVWGIDAKFRRDARTGLPYLLPTLAPEPVDGPSGRLLGPVHVVGGGGAATPCLRALAEEGFLLTAGVLALLDSDTETAQELGIAIAVDAPFSAIGDDARQQNRRLLSAAKAIVVTPFAVGPANLCNLEDVGPFVGRVPVYLLDGVTLERRDFTGGPAAKVRDALTAAGAESLGSVHDLVARLRTVLPSPRPEPERVEGRPPAATLAGAER